MNCLRITNLVLFSLFLIAPSISVGGWLNPHYEVYPECTEPAKVNGLDLLKLTKGGQLFIALATPELDATESIIARRHGFRGVIFDRDLFNDERPMPAGQILFTGTVVLRDSSVFERVLGGSPGDSFYYVVELASGQYLLHPESFDDSGLQVCDELQRDMEQE